MPQTSTIPVALPPREAAEDPRPAAEPNVPYWRSLIFVVLGAAVLIFSRSTPHAVLVPESGVVMHLPGYVRSGNGFVGIDAPVSPAENYILPKDTEFARKNYTDYPGRDAIFCGIVLSGALNQSIHRPEVCLIAQGWKITNQEDVPITLDSGRVLTVRNLTITKTEMTRTNKPITLVSYNMYWFVGDKVTTPYHYVRIFLSSWDRIAHNRANRWAYVTVSSTITKGLIPQGLDAEQTRAMMIDFIRQVVPTFQKSEMPPGATSAG